MTASLQEGELRTQRHTQRELHVKTEDVLLQAEELPAARREAGNRPFPRALGWRMVLLTP